MPDGGWVATHEDITEQRMSEKALAEARVNAERAQQEAQAAHARLVEAFDVVPEGIAMMDADDRLVLWNSQYAETYRATGNVIVAGMRFEDLLRKGLARGQYADAIDREEEWLAARLAGHALPSNRHEQLLSSGRYIVVEERRSANGGSIGVRIDVTEMKHREESFRLLFKSNPVPMWVIDAVTLKFLAVNDAAVAHYGYSRDQFLRMTALDLRSGDERNAFSGFIQAEGGSQGRKDLAPRESGRNRHSCFRLFQDARVCRTYGSFGLGRRRYRAHPRRGEAARTKDADRFGHRQHVAGPVDVRQRGAARAVQSDAISRCTI